MFDILAVSGTRITKKTSLLFNINLWNYSFHFTSAVSSAGGTLLYITVINKSIQLSAFPEECKIDKLKEGLMYLKKVQGLMPKTTDLFHFCH